MNCRINTEQKCKQATVEQAPSAAPSRISDPGWGDNSLQGCEVCDGCRDRGKIYSAKRTRTMFGNLMRMNEMKMGGGERRKRGERGVGRSGGPARRGKG
jgi:hypothetical protein